MWQRFTEQARKAVFYAQQEAQEFGEGYVSTEHLLLALTTDPDSTAFRTLVAAGVLPKRVRAEIERQLPRGDSRPSKDMTLTPRAKRVIDLAYDEARGLNHNYIGTEHLLLGLIREADGLAGRVLRHLGVEIEEARRQALIILGENPELSASQQAAARNKQLDTAKSWATKMLLADEATKPWMDQWSSFREDARYVILCAQAEAQRWGEGYITSDHLLLGLLHDQDSEACRILASRGVGADKIKEHLAPSLHKNTSRTTYNIPFSGKAKDLLEAALKLNPGGDPKSVGSGHILAALASDPDCLASVVLAECGVESAQVMAALADADPGADADENLGPSE